MTDTSTISRAFEDALAHTDPPHRKFHLLRVARMACIDRDLRTLSAGEIEALIRERIEVKA